MRPRPYRFDAKVRSVFVDAVSGEAIRDDGQVPGWRYAPKSGRMHVGGLLAMAAAEGCRRVFLTGRRLTSTAWLDDDPGEGWAPAGHFYELRDPCGRWADRSGRVTEIRRAASWLGEGDYSPRLARDALAFVHLLLMNESRGVVGVMASPAASGQSLWAQGLTGDWPDGQLSDELAELVRSVSPQHREELAGRCFDGCDAHTGPPKGRLPGLAYLDGRFMFAACCRELGVADGAVLLDRAAARSLLAARPFARALLHVRVCVPEGWAGAGLLPVKHPNGRNWHYPNRPGWEGETWADAAEVHAAELAGWPLIVEGALAYGEGARPLDRFADRVVRLRGLAAADAGGGVGELAAGALRSMFVRTVGGFHSRGRERTFVVPAGVELPRHVTRWEERPDGRRVYTERVKLSGNALAFARPELSSQVWARARRRVTDKLLTVDAATLVGVWGDALYLTGDPGWADPGTPGFFRLKGKLDGPLTRPTTLAGLLRLRSRMEA